MKKGIYFWMLILVVVLAACGGKESSSSQSEPSPTVWITPTMVDSQEVTRSTLDILGVWERSEGVGLDTLFGASFLTEEIEITPHYIVVAGSSPIALPYVWEGDRIVVESLAALAGTFRVMIKVEREGNILRFESPLLPEYYTVLVPKGTKEATEGTPTPTPAEAGWGGYPVPTPYVACPGQMETYLWVGGYAYVADTVPNRVRSGPGKSYEVVGRAAPGEMMEILDGPECADGWTWYKVRLGIQNVTGWTAEGDGKSQYWLRPCPIGTECGIPPYYEQP